MRMEKTRQKLIKQRKRMDRLERINEQVQRSVGFNEEKTDDDPAITYKHSYSKKRSNAKAAAQWLTSNSRISVRPYGSIE